MSRISPSYFGLSNKKRIKRMLEESKKVAESNPCDYVPSMGEQFTISNNMVTGDRSYSNEIMTCIGVNRGHVKALRKEKNTFRDDGGQTILLQKSEYHFYPEDDLN